MQNLETNLQIGDFRIEKRLGAGGMGVVYLARQISLNRLVALKVLGTALSDHSEIARFQREAHAIARLNHPGIAGIYFVGQDSQVCYIAMEYIDGASLRDVLKVLVASRQPGQSIDAAIRRTSPAVRTRPKSDLTMKRFPLHPSRRPLTTQSRSVPSPRRQ